MESVMYIKTDVLFWLIQSIPGSADSDTVTVEIRRLSDDYTWDFTDLEFNSDANTGDMTFVNDIVWKQSFTPPTDDTYIVTIEDSTLALKYVQVLKALGDTDSFTFRTNSEVSICNLALTMIGATTITSLTDDSEEARKCSMVYTRVRDKMLRAHPWNFAIKRETLTATDETPEYDYTYSLELPSDYLRILDVDGDVEFKIEGGKLLCDYDELAVRYIYRNEDAGAYPANFVTAFAAELAATLAYAISNNRSLAADLEALSKKELARAKSEDAQEGTPREPIGNEWLESRV